jgi:hypothetical protein
MASRHYVIEVSFNSNNKWEQIGEKYPLMHKAVEHMDAIDLTFPTRVVKVTREVVLQEINGTRKTKRKRVAKAKKK